MGFLVKGVESIELAPVGANGALPTTGWVKFEDIEDGSVSFNLPEKTRNKLYVEDKKGAIAVFFEEGEDVSVSAKGLDLDPKNTNILAKGDFSSTGNRFEAPIDQDADVNLAVRITSKPQRGFKMVFVILYGSIVYRIENALTKSSTEALALGFTAEALAVTDKDGKQIPHWYYEKVAVA